MLQDLSVILEIQEAIKPLKKEIASLKREIASLKSQAIEKSTRDDFMRPQNDIIKKLNKENKTN